MKKVLKDTVLVGILAFIIALICFLFGVVLEGISELIFMLFPYNLLLLPFVGILIVYCQKIQKPKLRRSMKKIFKATKFNKELSAYIVPFQIVATWLSHLAGASVGREGVALQIGGTFGNKFARVFEMDHKLLTSSGKAAGFSALFGTPLAGLFFVYELNHKKITDIYFWYITVLMVYLSSFFATTLGLSRFHRDIDVLISLNVINIFKLIVAAIIFVIVGNLFAYILKWQRRYYITKFKNPYKRIILLSIVYIIIMFLLHGKYMSTGSNLVNAAFDNNIAIGNFDFMLKLMLTTFVLSIGYQGGEVAPLFAVGSTLGVVVARVLGLPVELMAALGYCTVFSSGTNAHTAGVFIAVGVFGIEVLPYILVTIFIAYIFKNYNGVYNSGIYRKEADEEYMISDLLNIFKH